MLRVSILAAGAALTLLASTAGAAEAREGGQCFFTNQIENFNPVDDHTVYLRLQSGRVYRIDSANSCPNLPYRQNHISLNIAGGGSTICKAVDIDMTVGSNGTADHCIVTGLRELTPAEIAALPKGQRP